MELIKNIIAIAFCLVIASCIKNNNYSVITDASKQLHCNIDSSYHIKKLSEVCDSVTFIPLETKNEAILGAIDKMIVDSTQVYILSSNYYQLEFVCERYAKDGQFIMLISKRNQRRYLINSNDYTDDLTFYNFRILPDFSCLHEQKYWGVIYPASWRECFNGTEVQSPSAQYKKIREYISSISDEQNPIICVYHIKQSLF